MRGRARIGLFAALAWMWPALALAQTAGPGPSTDNAPSRGGGSAVSAGVDVNWELGCGKGGQASGKIGCNRRKDDVRQPVRVKPVKPRRVVVSLPEAEPVKPTVRKPVRLAVKKPAKVAVKTPSRPKAPAKLAALPRPKAKPAVTPVLTGDFVADEVLVLLDETANAGSLAAQFNLVVRNERRSALLGARLVRFAIPDGRTPQLVLAALANAQGVTGADVNTIYALQAMRTPGNYAFDRIGLPVTLSSGAGVAIAVIDSATDPRHPALKKAYAGFFDALPDRPVVDATHGTAVGGLIAGGGKLPGLAPKARLFHARAFEDGKSTMDAILAAFDWAVSQDVRIVNMSFAGPKNALMSTACEAALRRGVVLVAAAGNNGPGAKPAYPGAYPGVIAVTATNDKDALMPQANRGDYVFAAAPGVDVIAPAPGGGADFVTGTSFAAAIASGAIANLIADDKARDAAWVEQRLSATAHDLGIAGRDTDFGFGLISLGESAATAAQ